MIRIEQNENVARAGSASWQLSKATYSIGKHCL
jgi:hypothetical protein